MSLHPRKKVLVVEDSSVARTLIEEIVRKDPRLELAGSVESAEEALALLPKLKPDVISLDIRLPGINGMEATRRIMATQPTPIVVVSASVEAEDLKISMNALKAGALAVVEKPAGGRSADYAGLARQLCRQLLLMSEVPLIRRHGQRDAGSALGKVSRKGIYQAVGLVASTGGPHAVSVVLRSLGASFPVPIFLVQHITPAFLDGFVAWLGDSTSLMVKIAEEGDRPEPGHVYVAPAARHLEYDGAKLRLTDGAAQSAQKPSGTILLQSLARSLGNRAIGVVLTGMGEDGAVGLRALHDAGAPTLAEDASTAIVYGMPKAAVQRGSVRMLLPLHDIAPSLLALCPVPEAVP